MFNNFTQIEFLEASQELEVFLQEEIQLGMEQCTYAGLEGIKETLKQWWDKFVAFLVSMWEKMKSWFKKADSNDATVIATEAKTDLEAAKKAAEEKGDAGLTATITSKIKQLEEFIAQKNLGDAAVKKAIAIANEAASIGEKVYGSIGKFIRVKLNLASSSTQLLTSSTGVQDLIKQADNLEVFANTYVNSRISEKLVILALINRVASGSPLDSVVSAINDKIPPQDAKLEFGLRSVTFDSTVGYPKYVYGSSARKADTNTKIKGISPTGKAYAIKKMERKLDLLNSMVARLDKLEAEAKKIPGDKLEMVRAAVKGYKTNAKVNPIVIKKLSIFENPGSAFTEESKILGFLRNEISVLIKVFSTYPLIDVDLKQNQTAA